MNFDVPKAKVYFSTIYLGEISKQLSNVIKKISQSYPQVNSLIIFKTQGTIRGQFVFKFKQPPLNRSNLIFDTLVNAVRHSI